MAQQGSIRREGVEVGVLGATAVAAWFFVADLVAGHAFQTPYSLGLALQGFLGVSVAASMPLTVLMYTIFHYLAFIFVGVVFAGIFAAADREPSILVGFAILFVALELASLGLTVLVGEQSAFRETAWYQVGAANLVAAFVMGTYMVQHHRRAVDGAVVGLRGI